MKLQIDNRIGIEPECGEAIEKIAGDNKSKRYVHDRSVASSLAGTDYFISAHYLHFSAGCCRVIIPMQCFQEMMRYTAGSLQPDQDFPLV
jgi:hypothetical protein